MTVGPLTCPGVDSPECGFSPDAPCASIAYVVNGIGPYVEPVTSPLHVVVGPGLFHNTSCGAYGFRPLNITGAGSAATTVDCEGTSNLLVAFSATFVSGLTVRRGAVTVGWPDSSVVSVQGGGAIAVLWGGGGFFPAPGNVRVLPPSLLTVVFIIASSPSAAHTVTVTLIQDRQLLDLRS
jgi:hypothetical protein